MIRPLRRGASSRRAVLIVGALTVIVAGCRLVAGPGLPGLAGGRTIPGVSTESIAALARSEWPAYAGTYASTKYSPLDQINRENVATLRIAWRWTSPDHAVRATNPTIDPS